MCERDAFIPTRESLLSRLRNWSDDASWQDFFQTYWRLIYSTALRAGLTEAEAQDVVQETVIRVSHSIKDFKYNRKAGTFKAWLLQQTRWRIADEARKRDPNCVERLPDPSGDEGNDNFDQLGGMPSRELEQIWDLEWDKNVLEIALERVKKEVYPKHFQIYDLLVMREWPIAKVAETVGISSMRVYVAKHRVAAALRRQIKYVQETIPGI